MSTDNIPFLYEKKNTLNYPKSMGVFSKGLKNEFETAMVNEPSVFGPLKFYIIIFEQGNRHFRKCSLHYL